MLRLNLPPSNENALGLEERTVRAYVAECAQAQIDEIWQPAADAYHFWIARGARRTAEARLQKAERQIARIKTAHGRWLKERDRRARDETKKRST